MLQSTPTSLCCSGTTTSGAAAAARPRPVATPLRRGTLSRPAPTTQLVAHGVTPALVHAVSNDATGDANMRLPKRRRIVSKQQSPSWRHQWFIHERQRTTSATTSHLVQAADSAPAQEVTMRDQILAMRLDDNTELRNAPATLVAAPPLRLRVSWKRKSPLWRDHHWLYEWQEHQKSSMSVTGVLWRAKVKVRDMFRKWYQKNKKATLTKSAWRAEWAELGQSQQRAEVQLAWTKLSEAKRACWLARGIIDNEPALPSAHVSCDGRDDGNEGFGNRVLGLGEVSNNYTGRAFLVTWNGEWGRNLDIWQRTTNVMLMKSQEFTTEVGSNPYYRGLFEKFRKCILRACTELRATDASMALERSMNSDNIWRVHFQVLLSTSSGNLNFKHGKWKLLEWDGVLPSHIVRCCHKRRGGSSVDMEGNAVTHGLFGRIEEGHYYFNYPKNGQLHQWSTLRKGGDPLSEDKVGGQRHPQTQDAPRRGRGRA